MSLTVVAEMFESRLIAWDVEVLERGADVVSAMTPLDWVQEQLAAEQG